MVFVSICFQGISSQLWFFMQRLLQLHSPASFSGDGEADIKIFEGEKVFPKMATERGKEI